MGFVFGVVVYRQVDRLLTFLLIFLNFFFKHFCYILFHAFSCKELFQLFITIFDTRYENEENTSVIDNINIEEAYVCLTLHKDINFENFFSKWCDIFKLYCERTIDKDLYNMWLEKQLKSFDRPINGAPFELNK
jgi:hypothetical protein